MTKTGVQAEMMAPEIGGYKLYQADLWECPDCGAQILNTAILPLAEHFQPDYQARRQEGAVQFWSSLHDRGLAGTAQAHVRPRV